jgi:endonuclease VIII
VAEGDTIFLLAQRLRLQLAGQTIVGARTTRRADVRRLVGTTVTSVESLGKNLLIRFSNGLTLRTHLGLDGTWRTLPATEAGRRSASRADLVLELDGLIAGCFAAPTVELFATRAEPIHPALRRLGPDLLGEFEPAEALARLRQAALAETTIAEALLDQRVMAGVGNVYRSEVLFIEQANPFASVASLDDSTLECLIETARRLLAANVRGARQGSRQGRRTTTGRLAATDGQRHWVYGLAGRPCRRCGTPIRAQALGQDLPRIIWWCPCCQA